MDKLSSLGKPSEPHENVNRVSDKATRGQGKEGLQQSLINFHLYMYFAQMKGKMTFRKSKLIDHGKCIITKICVMSVIVELTLKKKTGRGRKSLSPSVKDNFRLCVILTKLYA